MTYSITKTDQGMALTGNLVYANVTELLNQGHQYIEQSLDSNLNEFIIDCKEIQRIDSAGISLLLEWQRKSNKVKKACHFIGVSDQAESLLKAYQLQSLFTK